MGLIERLKEHGANALGAYKSLVQKVVAGEEASETEADDILRAAGKSLGDLEADVAKQRRIVELQQIISGEPDLLQEERELLAQQAVKFEELVERRREVEKGEVELNHLSSRLLQLRDAKDQLGQARAELERLTRPPKQKEAEPGWRPGPLFPVGGESVPLASDWGNLASPMEIKKDAN